MSTPASPASPSWSPTTRPRRRRRSGSMPTPRWSWTTARVAWVGPRGQAPAADRRIDVGGRAVDPRVRRQPRPPRLRRRPGGGVRGPDVGRAVRRRRHRAPPWPPRAPPPTTSCARDCARLVAEMRAPGHHDRRDQERLRADRRATRPRALRLAAEVTAGDHVPRRARRAARVRRRPRRLRRPGHRPDARRLRAARPVDRRLLRAGSAHAFDGDEARGGAAGRPGAGLGLRVHANQLSAGPGRAAGGRARRRPAPTTAPTSPTPTSTRSPAGRRSRRCCPASSSPPGRRIRTPGGCSTPGVTVALATDCNPGSCFTSSMAFCIALAVREMRMTPAEALWSATAGGAAALRRDRRRAPRRRGARPTSPSLDAPSYLHLAYRPGVPLVRALDLPEGED